MPLTFSLRTIALGACLLLPLQALGADNETTPPSPADKPEATSQTQDLPLPTHSPEGAEQGAVQEARALMDAGRFMEAVSILGPLVAGEVIEANTLFLYGLAALGASQQQVVPEETRQALLDQAISSFHAMLVEAPALMRVRLELARAFYLKGEDELARRHFEYVLAGEPPEPVVANVRRFLSEIEGRGRWSYRIGAALAPDSNIGGTSDERIIYIFDLPFERDIEELTTSGIGVSVWGGAEYQKPLWESIRLRAGAEFARREYERSEFDQLFVGTHLGPRWQVDQDTGLSVLASARQRWLGTAPDNRELGGRLELNHRLSRTVTLGASAAWHGRRYRTRDYLDGPVFDSSLRAAWVVLPTVRLDLSGGYAWERPTLEQWRTRSHWVGTGVSVILPAGFNVGRRRRGALGRLPRERGPVVPEHRRRVQAGGPHPQCPAFGPQPGLHPPGLQPRAGGRVRGARDQRPALRLRAHPGRAPVRAAVLMIDRSRNTGGEVRRAGDTSSFSVPRCYLRAGRRRGASELPGSVPVGDGQGACPYPVNGNRAAGGSSTRAAATREAESIRCRRPPVRSCTVTGLRLSRRDTRS